MPGIIVIVTRMYEWYKVFFPDVVGGALLMLLLSPQLVPYCFLAYMYGMYGMYQAKTTYRSSAGLSSYCCCIIGRPADQHVFCQ